MKQTDVPALAGALQPRGIPGVARRQGPDGMQHHTAGPSTPIGRALRSIPEWCTAATELLKLHSIRIPTPRAEADVTELVDAVLNGTRELDDNLLEDAERVAARHRGAVAVAEAIEQRRRELTDDLRDAAPTHRVLPTLNAQLTDTLEQARQAWTVLGGSNDLAAAVGLDKLDEYQTLQRLQATYLAIRAAYGQVLASAGGSYAGHANKGALSGAADILAVAPTFPIAGTDIELETDSTITRPTHNVPEDWDNPEAFLWLLDHPEAHAWLPSTQERDQAADWLRVTATKYRDACKSTRAVGRSVPVLNHKRLPGLVEQHRRNLATSSLTPA